MKKTIRLTESDLTRIVRRVMNESEAGDEWYRQIKEYERYLINLLSEAGEKKNIREYPNNANHRDYYEMIYFDNIDEVEENEILDKMDEIEEFLEKDHNLNSPYLPDPAWTMSVRKLLRHLNYALFVWRSNEYEKKYGLPREFYEKKAGYKFKKPYID